MHCNIEHDKKAARRSALPLLSQVVNFGTQIVFFVFCVPGRLCLSSRSWSSLAHKSAFSGFVCQPGSVSHSGEGHSWHTNRLFRVLCARPALSLTSVVVNFGTQIGFFGFCVPGWLCLSLGRRSFLAHKSAFSGFVCQPGSVSGKFRRKKREICGTQIARIEDRVPLLLNPHEKMKNFWHTNRQNSKSCATPHQPQEKNGQFLAHKSPKLEIVCHSSSAPGKK